jgi:hypothetical protein
MKGMAVVTALAIVLCQSSVASAAIVDFEGGFADLDPVGAVVVPGNTVTFSVGPSGVPTGTGFIAEVGDPATSFVPADTPAAAVAGRFLLSDEDTEQLLSLDYFIDFANPVLNLGLDLFDVRGDGGGATGDVATLNAYADATRSTLVGSDSFTVPSPQPVEGNVVNLSIPAPSAPIVATHLTFSGVDVGTGIDNITFTNRDTVIPEASSIFVWSVLSALGLCAVRWRRSHCT